MKKVLLVANVSKEHIRKFHIPFIEMMQTEGWIVDVACRLDEPIPECNKAFDLPCDRNPFNGGLAKSIKILKNIIRENHYDVVHCNTVTGSIIARLAASSFRKKGVKVIYTNHGLHFFKGASISRWAYGYCMERALARKTDLLITINDADCQMARKYLSKCKNIEQIHGIGVNLDRFRNCLLSDEDKACLRAQIGLLTDDYVISYVAELNENKNQYPLLKVLKQVKHVVPSAKLMLVGPDHESGKLANLAKEEGLEDSVLLLGWRNDIPELLHVSDMYVASSKSEGLGLNIIEAMACNLPVVAFENRGHNEIINHGINGYLVEQDDCKTMASLIVSIYQDKNLKNQIVKQAQLDISKYQVENVLKEMRALYSKYC